MTDRSSLRLDAGWGASYLPEHLLTVVVRKHERFYGPELCGAAPGTVVVQPENRGTAPAILYALSRLAITAPTRPVAIVPSDHYVSDDDAFMARVQSALDTTQVQAERVILLGIEPDRPETEYGWIEPGELLLGQSWPLYAVKRFWEKPPAPMAERLARAGCFWNSFVIVAHPATLQDLIRAAVPPLAAAFMPLVARLGTAWEAEAARTVYAPLPVIDFSKRVLQARPAKLAVFPSERLRVERPRRSRARLRDAVADAPECRIGLDRPEPRYLSTPAQKRRGNAQRPGLGVASAPSPSRSDTVSSPTRIAASQVITMASFTLWCAGQPSG